MKARRWISDKLLRNKFEKLYWTERSDLTNFWKPEAIISVTKICCQKMFHKHFQNVFDLFVYFELILTFSSSIASAVKFMVDLEWIILLQICYICLKFLKNLKDSHPTNQNRRILEAWSRSCIAWTTKWISIKLNKENKKQCDALYK